MVAHSSPSNLPVVVIACRVFQGLLERYFSELLDRPITYLDFALHTRPRHLNQVIQEQIDGLITPSLVVLGYGLCGNSLHGITAGVHTLIVPRADDCITILLGSYQAFRHQFDQQPATYYLTKGWLAGGSHPLNEYQQLVAKYGVARATWIMDQQYRHYKRLAFVAHNTADFAEYRPLARKVHDFCSRWGMEYAEIKGSEEYIRRFAELVQAITEGTAHTASEDFIIIPPGGVLQQSQFLRWE